MIHDLTFERVTKRLYGIVARLRRDERGIAATEFAFVAPLMLVMFFGTVEMTSGIAVDRKVTIIARTMSDLTSQSDSVSDADFDQFYAAAKLIMWPYVATINARVSELYVNPAGTQATVIFSKGYGTSVAYPKGMVVPALASALSTGDTYLIYSEVNYVYVPAVGYIMNKLGVTLKDVSYTKPRIGKCVLYNTTTPPCPTS